MNQWQTLQALDHKKPFDHAKSKTQYQSFQLDSPTSGQLNICPLTALGMARYYKLLTGVVKVPHEKPQEDPQPCADLGSAWPDIPHMVTDSLCCRHGTGQLPGLDDCCAPLLHRLKVREEGHQRRLMNQVTNRVGEVTTILWDWWRDCEIRFQYQYHTLEKV